MPEIRCPVCGGSAIPPEGADTFACPDCDTGFRIERPPPLRAVRVAEDDDWETEEHDDREAVRLAAAGAVAPFRALLRLGIIGAGFCFFVAVALVVFGFYLLIAGETGREEACGGFLSRCGGALGIVGVPLFALNAVAGHRITKLAGSFWFVAAGLLGILSFLLMPIFSVAWATFACGIWAWVAIRRSDVGLAIRFNRGWRIGRRRIIEVGDNDATDDREELEGDSERRTRKRPSPARPTASFRSASSGRSFIY